MADLWLVVSGSYDGRMKCVPIYARTKEQVGNYIRNHIEKFYDIFYSLGYADNDSGKIRKELQKKDIGFFDSMHKNTRQQSIDTIKSVLEPMTNEEIVDEFWGYDRYNVSHYVTIRMIPNKKFIYCDDNDE